MRWIHTADWHLGRLFHGVHLTEDQAYILDQLIGILREARPDLLIVAGDIYDRAVPPPEAVNLLDEVLSRIVLGLKVPVILIAGNHDSPDRLGFASRLLAAQGLHVHGALPQAFAPLILEDRAGPVCFYPLPYAEPAVARERLQRDSVADAQGAMEALVEAVRQVHPAGRRAVAIGHAFVSGGLESESERPLSVGGAATVEACCFGGFHYTALGHLHRPQAVGSDTIHYSGSILKYSFSEARDSKSVHLVEMDAEGRCRVEKIPLAPKRDLRCLEGCLQDILKNAAGDPRRHDYLQVTLLDRGAILDAMGKIRDVYPNALQLSRPALRAAASSGGSSLNRRQLSDADLFSAFYREVTGGPLAPEQATIYEEVVSALYRAEREAVP
ncbi:MAG: exonuclease SbcCD subunit D [Planctomycetes bacterium]|nr:exonuclease SbcCD subunit D [Planctomycetota bacterium]